MALQLLRTSGGCLSAQLLRSAVPLSATAFAQKKHLTLTPVNQKRIYGPSEGSQPSYTEHWTHGRYVMMGLIPGIPIALAFPNPFLDLALSGALVLHSHWGLTGMVNDYFHDKTLNMMGNVTMTVLSALAMAGLIYLIYNDIGFSRTVRKIYTEL